MADQTPVNNAPLYTLRVSRSDLQYLRMLLVSERADLRARRILDQIKSLIGE